ncbi:hypothetical protein LCGC14_0922630 [marine sediment metagenome]|uniref:Uncharacterized protein n=1 Tax=marine sediment metagenome TaxID=412755 RepID=A0A0F9RWX5_9ZZZZ
MANRPKTERNQKIWEYWDKKGWRQQSIANKFQITVGAVGMVLYRERKRRNKGS